MEDNTSETIPEELTFKEFKKEIKALGYQYKTFKYNSSNSRFLEVYQDGTQINTQIVTHEHLKKHKQILDFLRYYRTNISDKDGFKVVF